MKHVIYILIYLVLHSCSSRDQDDQPVLTSIEITSSEGNLLDLNGNITTTLTAHGKDQSGEPIDINSPVAWSSNNTSISVDDNGVVTALAQGNSTVTATINDISGTFEITVVATSLEAGTYIYVSDAGNFDVPPWQILRYNEDGSNPVVFTIEGLAWPQDIVFLEDRNEVLISNLNSGIINIHNATTGVLTDTFASNIGGPTRMKIGKDSLLYVLQWTGNGKVLRFDLDGNFIDEFTSTGVSQSIGMDWDAEGNLYVSSFNGRHVRKFDASGDDMGLYINSNLTGPTNIWFDSGGNMLVNDWEGDKVVKFDNMGNFIEDIISSGIDEPEGVDFFRDGSFAVGSGGTSEVKLYDKDANFISNLIASKSGGLLRPNAVVIRVVESK